VRAAAGRPESWWSAVADIFENQAVLAALRGHQQAAREAGGNVTLLRALDIAIWMRQHTATSGPVQNFDRPLDRLSCECDVGRHDEQLAQFLGVDRAPHRLTTT